MARVEKSDLCCGCRACEQDCPQKCIKMNIDSEGFYYPYIDDKRCTNCGICSLTCTVNRGKVAEDDGFRQ